MLPPGENLITELLINRVDLVPSMKRDFVAVRARIRNVGLLVLACLATVCRGPTDAGQRVTSLGVSLDSGLVYVSDSLFVHAVAHDAQGNPVASATIIWSSRDSRVARVSPAGWVTGVKGGRTTILADAGSVRDSLFIVVLRRGVTVIPRGSIHSCFSSKAANWWRRPATAPVRSQVPTCGSAGARAS